MYTLYTSSEKFARVIAIISGGLSSVKMRCTVAPTHPEVQFCQRKHSGVAVAALSQRFPLPGAAGFSVASAANRNMARTGRETQSLHR